MQKLNLCFFALILVCCHSCTMPPNPQADAANVDDVDAATADAGDLDSDFLDFGLAADAAVDTFVDVSAVAFDAATAPDILLDDGAIILCGDGQCGENAFCQSNDAGETCVCNDDYYLGIAGCELCARPVPQDIEPNTSGDVPFGFLDSPQLESEVRGSVLFAGWVLASAGVQSASLFIDGQVWQQLTLDRERADVCAAYPDLPCERGFHEQIDLSALTPCDHLIEIWATDNAGHRALVDNALLHVLEPVVFTGNKNFNIIIKQIEQSCSSCGIWFDWQEQDTHKPRLVVQYSVNGIEHSSAYQHGNPAAGPAHAVTLSPYTPTRQHGMLVKQNPSSNGLFWADISDIPSNAQVSQATLYLYLESDEGLANSDNSSVLQVYECPSAWDFEQVSWSRASNAQPWTTVGGDTGQGIRQIHAGTDIHDRGYNKINNRVPFDFTPFVQELLQR